MRRWLLALMQSAMLMLIVSCAVCVLDLIVPPSARITTTGWYEVLIAGVVCWMGLAAIFHRVDDPEEL